MRRIERVTLVAGTVLMPLFVLPVAAGSFARAKLWLLGALVAAGLIAERTRFVSAWAGLPGRVRLTLAVWLAAVGASAAVGAFVFVEPLLLVLLGVAWCVVLVGARVTNDDLTLAIEVGATALAAVAVAQAAHLDVFALAGWRPLAAGGRMRIYGTLGNPDFVAAFLCGAMPVTLVRSRGAGSRAGWHAAALVLQLAAVVAAGSRAPLVAVGAVALWWTVLRVRGRLAAVSVVAAAALVAALLILPAARDVGTKWRGRVYLWKVAVLHVMDHPLLGVGPGGLRAVYAKWEADYWRDGRGTAVDRAYRGVTDHAHNDYLEAAVDAGLVGGLAWVAVVVALLWTARRTAAATGSAVVAGASAGAVALLGVALVDFPFARPAAVFLWWTLWAVCLRAPGEAASTSDGARSA